MFRKLLNAIRRIFRMSPLPGSRDYDAVDAGPLPHTTVNNLQDGIVGAKHGELVKFIGFERFVGDDLGVGNGAVYGTGNPFVQNEAGSGFDLRAAVDLPAGSVISRLDWVFDRAGDSTTQVIAGVQNVNANFLETVSEAVATGTFLLAQVLASALTVQGVQVPSTGALPPIGPLYLLASSANEPLVGRNRFYGVYLTYTKP